MNPVEHASVIFAAIAALSANVALLIHLLAHWKGRL